MSGVSLSGGVHSPLSRITSQKRYGVKNTEQEMKGTRDGSGHGGPHSQSGQTQTTRRGGGREEEEEKEAKTVAAQTAGSSSHAARRRTRTHAHIRTHKHAQLLLSGRGHAQN